MSRGSDTAARTAADILSERAKALAKPREDQTSDAKTVVWEVAVVRVGHQLWGLPLHALERVLRTPPVTPLPGQPSAVIGVAHAFGELVSVVSGQRLFDAPGTEPEPWVVGLVMEPGVVALAVDEVMGARRVTRDALDASWPPHGEGLITARTLDHVAILDLAALRVDARIVTEQAAGGGGA